MTIFLNNSNNVFTEKRFLKYFVGFNLSSFGIKGAIATKGPTCIKSPIIATNAATIKTSPIIVTVGITALVKIYGYPIVLRCWFGICSYRVLNNPFNIFHIIGAIRFKKEKTINKERAVDTSFDFTT